MTKHRPWLPTVILVGIVVLLALFIFLVLPNLERPAEPGAQPTRALLWEFTSSDLVSITVVKGTLTTTVEYADMTWRVTAPTPGDADTTRAFNSANQIADMRSRVLEDADPAVFGLEEPQAEVTLGLQDGTTASFKIGDENPSRTDYYVQKEGDSQVHLVAASAIEELLSWADSPPYPATPVPSLSPETPTIESPTETPEPTPRAAPTSNATETEAPAESPVETPTS